MYYTNKELTEIKYSEKQAMQAAVTISKERNMSIISGVLPTNPSIEKTLTLETLNKSTQSYLANCFHYERYAN